jgi:hypothetical protein
MQILFILFSGWIIEPEKNTEQKTGRQNIKSCLQVRLWVRDA